MCCLTPKINSSRHHSVLKVSEDWAVYREVELSFSYLTHARLPGESSGNVAVVREIENNLYPSLHDRLGATLKTFDPQVRQEELPPIFRQPQGLTRRKLFETAYIVSSMLQQSEPPPPWKRSMIHANFFHDSYEYPSLLSPLHLPSPDPHLLSVSSSYLLPPPISPPPSPLPSLSPLPTHSPSPP